MFQLVVAEKIQAREPRLHQRAVRPEKRGAERVVLNQQCAHQHFQPDDPERRCRMSATPSADSFRTACPEIGCSQSDSLS